MNGNRELDESVGFDTQPFATFLAAQHLGERSVAFHACLATNLYPARLLAANKNDKRSFKLAWDGICIRSITG